MPFLIGERLDYGTLECEVILPMLPPWLEETHELAGLIVDRTHIAPLPYVASKASIGEVGGIRSPAMFATYDMVDLVGRIRVV